MPDSLSWHYRARNTTYAPRQLRFVERLGVKPKIQYYRWYARAKFLEERRLWRGSGGLHWAERGSEGSSEVHECGPYRQREWLNKRMAEWNGMTSLESLSPVDRLAPLEGKERLSDKGPCPLFREAGHAWCLWSIYQSSQSAFPPRFGWHYVYGADPTFLGDTTSMEQIPPSWYSPSVICMGSSFSAHPSVLLPPHPPHLASIHCFSYFRHSFSTWWFSKWYHIQSSFLNQISPETQWLVNVST
jgi:hypothetical protein